MAAGTVRKYKYEDLLQFILPHMTERATLSNISLSQEEETEDDDDNREETEEDNDASNKNRKENNEPDTEMTCDEGTSARTGKIPKRDLFMTPAQNKKKKQLDVSSQSDNSPSAQLMSYILEEKRNEKQQQLSSQPLHHQVHPVDAFLSGISHTLKTLNPLQLNEARTRIFAIVQEIERSQLLESQSRAMVHHEVPPLPICQASFSGSTYPPRIPGSHPRVPTHPETQALPIIYQASPAGSTYSSSPAYSSTPLPSPNYNNVFPPSTPASTQNPTDTIIPLSAEQNSQPWC